MTYRRIGSVPLVAFSILLSSSAMDMARAETPDNPAKRSDGSNCDRAAFRVILDVGHTLDAPGAMSARGVPEYEFNLRLAKQIERNLGDAGFGGAVLLVSDGPGKRSLYARMARINRSPADLLLSIHHDSVPDSFLERWEFEGSQKNFSDRFGGHSIFVSDGNGERKASLQFAKLLGHQLKARGLQYTSHYTEAIMGKYRRDLLDAEAGVYRYDKLFVLKMSRMPAALLEAGSIINRAEELLVGSPERQSLVGAAVTDAVESFCAARSPRVAHKPAPKRVFAARVRHSLHSAVRHGHEAVERLRVNAP